MLAVAGGIREDPRMIKSLLLCVWGWGIVCVLFPSLPYADVGTIVVQAMLLVHILECFAFYKAVRDTGEPPLPHLLQILLFGVFHYRTLGRAAASSEGSGGN